MKAGAGPLLSAAMKFFAALLVHFLLALFLGAGILLLVAKGQWWLLITGTLTYVALIYWFGVRPNCPPAGPTAH